MNNCPNLFLLSAISCELAKVLTSSELSLLGAELSALGDMLAVIAVQPETGTSAENDDI